MYHYFTFRGTERCGDILTLLIPQGISMCHQDDDQVWFYASPFIQYLLLGANISRNNWLRIYAEIQNIDKFLQIRDLILSSWIGTSTCYHTLHFTQDPLSS